jgi:hypothetical protein
MKMMPMKRTIILLTLLIAIHSSPAAEGERISVHLKKVSLQTIFRFYKKLSGLDPVLSSDVKKMSEQTLIDFDTGDSMLKSEAIKALEKVVMKQAGVVITPLDSSTASVTYNDALLPAFAKKATARNQRPLAGADRRRCGRFERPQNVD